MRSGAPEFLRLLGQDEKAILDAAVDGIVWEFSRSVALARLDIGQQGNRLVDPRNRVNVKFSGPTGLDHVTPQHQVPDIGGGNDYAVRTVKPLRAEIEKAFDLLVDAPDRLNLA